MQKNDEIVVYLVGMKLAAICEVVSDYYYDETKIWEDGIYPHRVQLEPVKIPTNPVSIDKIYHVYLGYKGPPHEYFGQAIRPLPITEFSIFQSELARNMNELSKIDKNDYTQDFAGQLKIYLENKFSVNLTKKRSHIFFDSGVVIHIRSSKIHSDGTGFYYLQKKDYEDAIKNTERFFVIVYGKVDTAFVIPSEKLKEIFEGQPAVIRDNEEPKWYFDVFKNNDKKHFLRIHSNSSSNVFDIENYLNKWEQIPELITPLQRSENKLLNYWVFIVSDHPKLKLSAQEIYETRMNDKFWGLNELTKYRKQLKKGDEVVFCHGAHEFLGTAKLETDCFELSEEEKMKFSHNIDFYKPNYGVMLSDIDIWPIPKEVVEYVQHLSFVSNVQQYAAYFQGGIKKIQASDYHLITGYKSYEELIAYLKNHQMKENYQPIVIKILIENPNGVVRQEIQDQLRIYNPESESQSIPQTVLSVLTKNGIIKKELDKYILNIRNELNSEEKNTLLNLCETRIKEFQSEPYRRINEAEEKNHIENVNVFLTSYDDKNLDISKKIGILGWKERPRKIPLSQGDLVFVFNSTDKKIETCFEIKSETDNKEVIWYDEKEAHPKKPIYIHRWDSKIKNDYLNITLDEISSFEPFRSDKKAFPLLLRNESPRSIDDPKYTAFRIFLLEKGTSSNTKYLLLLQQPNSKWNDIEGSEYNFGNNVPNHNSIIAGARAVFFNYTNNKMYFFGQGIISSVIDKGIDGNTPSGRPIIRMTARLNDYKAINITEERSRMIEKQIMELPNFNKQHSIKEIPKELYDLITSEEYNEPGEVYELDDAPLEFPSQSVIDTAIDKILQDLYVSKDVIMQVLINIMSGRHVILAGPVGTGKTTLAKLIGELFWEKDGFNGYFSKIYTATTEWSSHDVIGGMVPRLKNDEPTYEIVLGCVSETVLDNWSESREHRVATIKGQKKYKGTWLIIDEFNRADIDKVFGQLFTSLETRILRVPVIEGKKIFEDVKIPLDYRIICTLNTSDKHYLFKLSDALKRRLAFVVLFPIPSADREKEIYYAIRNGLNELSLDFNNLVVINSDTKTVDRDKSDKEMLSIIDQAYYILQVIRMIKPLGTAILKSIYQALFVGVKLTNDYEGSLDISINSNLIPQLESMSLTSLESIFYFLFRNPVEFFRGKHEGNDRDQYQPEFTNFLKFIHPDKYEQRSKQFLEKIDDSVWNSLMNSYTDYKKEIKCPLFRNALEDLMKVSLI